MQESQVCRLVLGESEAYRKSRKRAYLKGTDSSALWDKRALK